MCHLVGVVFKIVDFFNVFLLQVFLAQLNGAAVGAFRPLEFRAQFRVLLVQYDGEVLSFVRELGQGIISLNSSLDGIGEIKGTELEASLLGCRFFRVDENNLGFQNP